MVFVKVRETYDLHTVRNKMSVIAIHTPKPDIIKRNFPGLLMQCKTYRPYCCDVRLACASVLPMDPLGVGTTEQDVAPEDLFNPILYSALTNIGMSQLEARINVLAEADSSVSGADVSGDSANVDTDTFTNKSDEFNIYYGLLSNAHGWKHAAPQSGLSMSGLRPLVYEMLYNVGDVGTINPRTADQYSAPDADGTKGLHYTHSIRGNAKPLPMINCTSYSVAAQMNPFKPDTQGDTTELPAFKEQDVPWINVVCAGIIIPPSRLHELFYRMVIEWTIEFSGIRPIGEVTTWNGLENIGTNTHYQNYDYSSAKAAITGTDDSLLSSEAAMVSANVDVKKVM